MAFDFGAALSSIGQIAPAMSEGAEIRRQRLNDQARAQQEAQAAQDTSAQRRAQTAREEQLTAQEQQNARRYIPISTKPERGSDGQYYLLVMDPQTNKIQRLPVSSDYDPNAEKMNTLRQLGIDPQSDLGRQYITGVKPVTGQPLLRQDENGNLVFIDKPGTGMPSATVNPPAQAAPGVTPTGVKGRLPASATDTVRTGQHFYVDNDNNLREVPYTTTTRHIPRAGAPTGAPATPPPAQPTRTGAIPPSGGGPGRVIGPSKLSTQERATLQTDQQITGFANEVLPQIEKAGLQNDNSYTSSVRALAAWGEYKAGRVPSDPFYASIIRPVAAISIAGAAPWVRIGRNRYTFDVIQQHLPHPWQTPARIYDNVKWLRDNVVPGSEKSILGPVSTQSNPNVSTPKPSSANDPLGIR